MLVKITGANEKYTTRSYKRGHNVQNYKKKIVVYFSFAPVISTSINRYVNYSDIQVLMMVTETEMINVDFTSY